MSLGWYGCLPSPPSPQDYRVTAPQQWDGTAFVDLAAQFPEDPYDQLQLGSCVPNGAAACADYARARSGLTPFRRPSRLFIYWQGRKRGGYPTGSDTGLQIRDGFQVLAKDGAPPEADWEYDITRFAEQPPAQAYTDAAHDEALIYGAVAPGDVDHVIASGLPVAFGFTVHSSFESEQVARTGIAPAPHFWETEVGGHCMVATSTLRRGRDIGPDAVARRWYRKCRNSWGVGWGLQGHVWVPESVFEHDASDYWAVTTMGDPAKPLAPAVAA